MTPLSLLTGLFGMRMDLTSMWPSSGVPEASIAAKRVKVPQDSHSHALKRPLPERLPKQNESSWRPVTRRPAREKLTLLEVMGGVWTFQDPENTCLYRCEVDPTGSEHWVFKAICTEREWISQSDAARLIGVSRQAIRSAIVLGRLCVMNSNGRPVVRRAEALGLRLI